MKKLNIIMLFVVGLFCAVSCDSDRDSNPVLQTPSSFVLNTPPYASAVYDLKNTRTIELTTSQPDYGFTAATTYAVQVSLDNTWVDATETAEASYATLATTFTSAKMGASASEMARIIVALAGWTEEEEVPVDGMDVHVRLKAYMGTDSYPVYSNSVKLSVLPYYVMLVDALPAPYYLIGACIGDGTWTNTAVGSSIIPMALVDGAEYDAITGKGKFVYTGYFPAGQGFKIIGITGSWDEQWGNGGAAGIDNPVHNDGGSSDFNVPFDGWYTVELNSVENTLSFTKTEIVPEEVHASMELVGDFNNWGNDGVEPLVMTKSGGAESNVWYADVTFEADGGCKFRTDNTWTNSWGGDGFPYAMTTGNNIPVKAGSYLLVFNDLDKCYYFFAKE